MKNDHSDTVVGIRQKGTDQWAYENENGKLAFGPLSARTLFYDSGQTSAINGPMAKARELGQGTIEQVTVRRNLEVLQGADA